MGTGSQRWDALDLLRGFSIIGMLLNLEAGSWSHVYPWLEHARWEGATPIDLVAPVFLFCVGAVLPLSLARRLDKGAGGGSGRGAAAGHVLWRTLALVGIGFFLNLYPAFDWAQVRIPGVLQRIGLTYGLSGLFLLACARPAPGGARIPAWPVAAAFVLILSSYFALLYFAPVPGYGAPRFDPLGSWPSVVDRAVFGPSHMFRWWPVDGKVVFDPEGILSTWPATAQVLFGALIGLLYGRGGLKRPLLIVLPVGAGLIALAVALAPVCPIIKNIWTPTFVLLTSGFALVVLALLSVFNGLPWFKPPELPGSVEPGRTPDSLAGARPRRRTGATSPGRALAFPARVFGANPLLAYILSFLLDPLWDLTWIKTGAAGPASIRDFAQASFETVLPPDAASLLFGLAILLLLFLVNLVCWRRRWFLKL